MPTKEITLSKSQIGQLLRTARAEAGVSQAEAAARVGMDAGNLSRLERGKHPASRATLIALAGVYGKPAAYFGVTEPSLGSVPRGTAGRSPSAAEGRSARPDPFRALRLVQNDVERDLIESEAPEEVIDGAAQLFTGFSQQLRALLTYGHRSFPDTEAGQPIDAAPRPHTTRGGAER